MSFTMEVPEPEDERPVIVTLTTFQTCGTRSRSWTQANVKHELATVSIQIPENSKRAQDAAVAAIETLMRELRRRR